jgi:CBS domain-containing protein
MADTQNLLLDISKAPSPKTSGATPEPELLRVYMGVACSYLKGGGAPTLTAGCSSLAEFEAEIDRLKAECDAILEEARLHLGAASSAAPAPRKGNAKVRGTASDDGATQRTLQYLRSEFRVRDCMTREVKTVRRNQKLSIVDELMKVGGFRHVVVLDEEDEIAGVISHRDIFHGALSWLFGQGEIAHQRNLELVTAKQVMQSDVQTIGPDASIPEAARIMRENQIGCLPIAEQGQLLGIITEGDFLSLLSEQLPPLVEATLSP